MKIAGLNFTKINAEKMSFEEIKDIKIDTNIDILDVKSAKTDIFKTKDEFLIINFIFIVDYIPKYAKVELEGQLIVTVDSKQTKEILKQWKDKKLPEEFRFPIFNFILRKSNLKALYIEENLNLPPHVPLPSLKKQEQ